VTKSTAPRTRKRTATATEATSAAVVVKKYGNRRLYDTHSSRYITLKGLQALVQRGVSVAVQDAATGHDLTREVLLQIVLDQKLLRESLPLPFLQRVVRDGKSSSSREALTDALWELSEPSQVQHADVALQHDGDHSIATLRAELHDLQRLVRGSASGRAPRKTPIKSR
jgi:polyhydroxyalkanoate synthesis repressor PhaR